MSAEESKEWFGILRIDVADKVVYFVRGDNVFKMDVDEEFLTKWQVGDDIHLQKSLVRLVY